MSAGMTVPSAIRTPVTLPPACSIPVTVVSPRNAHPGCAWTARCSSCDRPRRGGQAVGGNVEAAQDRVLDRSSG